MMDKVRIDQLLVVRGFFESRAAAQASIAAGGVVVDGKAIEKSSSKVHADADISAVAAHPYVSRGGLKLAHALDVFTIDPSGWRCLDLGASTGGFTDVLLRRGAAHVISVDVGHGQLHHSLRDHADVTVLEQTDVRELSLDNVGPDIQLLVGDLSFISLEKALPVALELVGEDCQLVMLFKPQFEVGRAFVGKGGIVTDSPAVSHAKHRFQEWLSGRQWQVLGWTDSPITGGDGNREYLVHAVKQMKA
ncbi:MAG: TlyA family RNA methyltransferase [Pseudomonadota bacterium]